MYCNKCGTVVKDGANFCASCGTPSTSSIPPRPGTHPEPFQPLSTVPAGTPTPLPTWSPEELDTLNRRYRRRRLIAFIAPFASLFGVVVLWGLFGLLGELGISALETLIDVINVLIPIIVALCVLAIPVGIVMGIIYTNRLQNLAQLKKLPPGVEGWNWGAFWLSWIWGIRFRVWISLLALVPYVGLVMIFILGAKGSEWAWEKNQWSSVEDFQKSRRRWNIAGNIIGILLTILIFAGILLVALETEQETIQASQPDSSLYYR